MKIFLFLFMTIWIVLFIYVILLIYVKFTKKSIDIQSHIFDNIVFVFHMDENELIIGFYNF